MALRRRPVPIMLVLGLLCVAAAVATPGAAAPVASRVTIVVRDFAIRAPREVAATTTRFAVRNAGPEDHELLVVRTPSRRLPLRRDGVTVDERALERRTVAVLEPIVAGRVRDVDVRLTPGRYVLFCNMTGHYLGGMHAVLTVR
jgi:uncharacterized cupredoxin-like copper-binding protein